MQRPALATRGRSDDRESSSQAAATWPSQEANHVTIILREGLELSDDDEVVIHMGAGVRADVVRAALRNYHEYAGIAGRSGAFTISVFAASAASRRMKSSQPCRTTASASPPTPPCGTLRFGRRQSRVRRSRSGSWRCTSTSCLTMPPSPSPLAASSRSHRRRTHRAGPTAPAGRSGDSSPVRAAGGEVAWTSEAPT